MIFRSVSLLPSLTMWRVSDAPPQPESFETAAAKRGSVAAAQSEVLPRRECPQTMTRSGSTSGMVSSASSPRESPHAQVEIVPGSSYNK